MTRPVYCDESGWVPVADGLRRRGWEIHTAAEMDTLGDADREQLAFATERDWLLATFDDEFLSPVETQRLDHAGIIFVKQAGSRIGDVVSDGRVSGRARCRRYLHPLPVAVVA